MQFIDKLSQLVSNTIQKDVSLASYTTFKIGGPAKYFCVVESSEELIKLVDLAEKNNLPYFILAGGSNVLVSDNGFDGLVMKIGFSRLKIKDNLIECDAGAALSKAVGEALSFGLAGLDWATGIPGTVGGAIRGNAGAYGSQISDNVKSVTVLRRGKAKNLTNKECNFSYRHSIFKDVDNKDIILSVVFELQSGDRAKIKQKMKEIIMERNKKFNNYSCAGCVFKNIEISENEWSEIKKKWPNLPDEFLRCRKIPAGWLIEECDLKGKKIGGAQVSDQHANVIINAGQATAEDVIILTSIIKQKVRSKFNLQLMEEIEYLGFK